MTVASLVANWLLALATAAVAIEGGAAVLKYIDRLGPGRTRRELDVIHEEVALLRHAVWMDITRAGQGDVPSKVDERIRNLLMSDGWTPDMDLAQRFGYFDLHRIMGNG